MNTVQQSNTSSTIYLALVLRDQEGLMGWIDADGIESVVLVSILSTVPRCGKNAKYVMCSFRGPLGMQKMVDGLSH